MTWINEGTITHSWMKGLYIVKMSVCLKLMYTFIAILNPQGNGELNKIILNL